MGNSAMKMKRKMSEMLWKDIIIKLRDGYLKHEYYINRMLCDSILFESLDDYNKFKEMLDKKIL